MLIPAVGFVAVYKDARKTDGENVVRVVAWREMAGEEDEEEDIVAAMVDDGVGFLVPAYTAVASKTHGGAFIGVRPTNDND